MNPTLQAAVLKNLAAHEGRSLSMYLDTKGVVTCGVGHALFCPMDAARLVWWRTTDILATKAEIADVYQAVRIKAKCMSLMLSYETTDELLTADLAKFERILMLEFPDLDSYPHSAQVAMFDIAFNCGSLAKWPMLTAAIKAQDWHKAAAECYRPDVSKDRNENTRDQLLSVL